jgi:hypothetical protein
MRPISFSHRTGICESLERRVLMSVVDHVNNADDSGSGSLRNALTFANTNTTSQTIIIFDIRSPDVGAHTIYLLSPLPTVTTDVDLQGTTDAAGNPLIELDGSGAGANADGLSFNRNTPNDTKPSLVSGFIIDRFSGNGISIAGNEPTNVFGCRIGTDSTGKHSHPNAGDGIFVNTPGCQIGQPGKGAAFGNLISANGGDGVEIGPSGADAIVQNNLIGTDVTGTSARPNGGSGIVIGAAFASIGGRRAHSGNVISGNGGDGIDINFGNDDILGNLIGTNAAGTALLANGTGNGGNSAINTQNVVNVSFGDSTAAGRNVICAGVGGVGIGLAGSQCTVNNDLIGTDITGDVPLSQQIADGPVMITQDGLDGVQVGIGASDDVIENCIIGGYENGVETNNASHVTVMNCHIGISADLKHAIPNGNDGIEFFESSNCTAEGNVIANSVSEGIDVTDNSSVGDRIIQNSIFSNGDLGINLGPDDTKTPLPNHAGNVAGPNHNQNYPVLTSAVENNGSTLITGTLSTTPNTDMLVEFFANDAADPSGFGEGQTLIGSTGVTTDGSGNGSFTNFHADAATFGQVITAAAINTGSANSTDGDTSEFSEAIAVTGASITGTVFNDANANGKQDAGEAGLKGRTVFVDSDNDGFFNSNSDFFGVTNSAGHFRIFGVSAGTYRLRLLGTASWQQTSPSPKKAYQDVSVANLSTTSGVLFGQEKSTARAAALAIDAGSGSAYIDHSGQTFAAGTTHQEVEVITFPVAGTDDDPLYFFLDECSRLNYSYSVPNGKYTLKLLFVDPTSTSAGQRIFNVLANSATVLKHFDIFAAAGAKDTALTKSIPLTITNKTLALELKGVVGDAIISAFELIPN